MNNFTSNRTLTNWRICNATKDEEEEEQQRRTEEMETETFNTLHNFADGLSLRTHPLTILRKVMIPTFFLFFFPFSLSLANGSCSTPSWPAISGKRRRRPQPVSQWVSPSCHLSIVSSSKLERSSVRWRPRSDQFQDEHLNGTALGNLLPSASHD